VTAAWHMMNDEYSQPQRLLLEWEATTDDDDHGDDHAEDDGGRDECFLYIPGNKKIFDELTK
jgi:hypothetical protein